MDKVLHYGGYGYNSESLQARIDEAISFKEQFPFLNGHNGKLAYIDFNRDYLVRKRLMASLADKDLDFAILHHHGAPDTQYLQATPQTNGIVGWKDLIKISIRSNAICKINR